MILGNVEVHNAGALETIPGLSGDALVRIPELVRNQLNDRARFVAADSVGCEIRFVCDSPNVDVYLTCSKVEQDSCEVRVFRGNFQAGIHGVKPGETQMLRLTEPEPFKRADRSKLQMGGFADNVWRVRCNRGGTFCFHGVDGHGYEIRPPKTEEKPQLNWLAYGSSITNSHLDGYPHVAARLLRADVQNKGLSGACHCEQAVADWLADACEWDIMTCELGINMRGGYTPDEFESRVDYLLRKLTDAHPDKPVIAINVYPNVMSPDWVSDADKDSEATQRETAYNEIVPKVVERIGAANLHFVSGSDILTDFTGLNGDLLHPDTFGHAVMGHNLARIIKEIIG